MVNIVFDDGLSDFLKGLDRAYGGDMRKYLKEVGEYMATKIRLAMSEQHGVGGGMPFKPLSPGYASRKQRAGGNPSRVMYGPSPGKNDPPRGAPGYQRGGKVSRRTRGGELAASWKRLRLTKNAVYVGAGGTDSSGTKNADKAAGNDDRLDVKWNADFLTEASTAMFDGVLSPLRGRA